MIFVRSIGSENESTSTSILAVELSDENSSECHTSVLLSDFHELGSSSSIFESNGFLFVGDHVNGMLCIYLITSAEFVYCRYEMF